MTSYFFKDILRSIVYLHAYNINLVGNLSNVVTLPTTADSTYRERTTIDISYVHWNTVVNHSAPYWKY